ncbi:hypothetical protein [Paenibacillus dokdonensis]|uniref:hypothetical protein n=1 Tax=Paenibacillus dokdonensis TaxID=2567944 RepID=UPI001457A123|nr:hypothetical protein [Paenibacillus dokdonensis]
MKTKASSIIAVIIIAIVVGFAISDSKGSEVTNDTAIDSSQTLETKQPVFKFSASAMKNSLEDVGYVVREEGLKTLNAYVAEYQSDKLLVRFDIYHNKDNDQIEWVEINVDASGYINLNKPDAQPNSKVVEATNKMASQAYKFPFFNKNSVEEKKLTEWIDSNIAKATKQSKVIETKIGDLYFNMYGQPYMRFLEITSAPKE